ncbi:MULTISPECIES: helix-turn-helix transcriptional regulator [Micromonosporaceae]|uniref:helix-turn-helix transcriptional regulator n=1 Tax=Micromonosporaceae TaxID=28056 RepID=UPI000F4A39F5|nr:MULTISPECIES: LuxR C-terminal-related transcriptional regulator [Micromonosporaceae]ROO62556.1 PAS domain S-box-containing protein [Micromonospora sp. Llam0]WBB96030.1 LuxR C-terminal-related transcriptional regulator [Solwaraspora sp. WMMA2059]WBC20065.1 LuxR C-terminal-related transcriptional regulator [Solwaraspora sp. WMMA2080]WJK32339.1 LuxR C-terminal-related transcriptional regulator [Solwaraspora sp. WMMA2065]
METASITSVARTEPGLAAGADPDLIGGLRLRPDARALQLDRYGRVVRVSAGLTRWIGWSGAQLAGRPFELVLHPDRRAWFRHRFSILLTDAYPHFVGLAEVTTTDGRLASSHITAVAVRGTEPPADSVLVLLTPENRVRRPQLTEVGARVLEGLAGGASTAELAASLHLSRKGVEYHVTALLRQARVTNRTALVAWAYHCGVLVPGSWPPRLAPEAREQVRPRARTSAAAQHA